MRDKETSDRGVEVSGINKTFNATHQNGRTNNEKINDYRRWHLASDVQKHTCNHCLST